MGWTSCGSWRNPSDVKREILSWYQKDGVKLLAHRSTSYGRNLWLAIEKDGERFIALYLISKAGGDYAYKGMTEMCGPCETDCPLALLELVPESSLPKESGYSAKWREGVRKQASVRKREIEVGSTVKVYGKEYRVLGKHKRSYKVQSLENGMVYRCSAAKMSLEQ